MFLSLSMKQNQHFIFIFLEAFQVTKIVKNRKEISIVIETETLSYKIRGSIA